MLGKAVNAVCHHRCLAAVDGLEQITVRHRTQALVPGHIAGSEVFHVGLIIQLFGDLSEQIAAHTLRPPFGGLEQPALNQDVALACQIIGPPLGHDLAQNFGQLVTCRYGHHVGWRALQHRDVGCLIGHGGHDCDSSGAAADDNDPLVPIVEIGRPVLGVNALPLELLHARKVGQIAGFVIVVTGATDKEVATEVAGQTGIQIPGADDPVLLLAAPLSLLGFDPEADQFVDAILAGGFTDVATNGLAVGECIQVIPRPEIVTEAEHVRIGAYSGIAEQVPCTANALAAFEDCQSFAGAFL